MFGLKTSWLLLELVIIVLGQKLSSEDPSSAMEKQKNQQFLILTVPKKKLEKKMNIFRESKGGKGKLKIYLDSQIR